MIDRQNVLALCLLRALIGVGGAAFLFFAGHSMRQPGSGIDPAFGLTAYGAAFAVLMLAVPVSALAALAAASMTASAAAEADAAERR